jgi:magnesium-transporting ATPase (P-type)
MFLTIFIGVTVSLMLFGLYLLLIKNGLELELARSILFASFGSYTLFISFSFLDLSRPLFKYSILENKLLLVGVGVGTLLMFATFLIPFFQKVFDVQPLPFIWIGFVVFWIILNVGVVELSKWFANRFIVKAVDKDDKLA